MKKSSPWLRQENQPAWLMGVLNCTPDSFSDGGQFVHLEHAVNHGLAMWQAGAAIIDVGGESTRPGAQSIDQDEELNRVIPVIQALVGKGCKVSIDTRRSRVMQAAVESGACMINDVSALLFDDESLHVAAYASKNSAVSVCLMHMQGSPKTMQLAPHYHDVLAEVILFFDKRIERCLQSGMPESSLILDPGIGFGKSLNDNLTLIANIDLLKSKFNLPILLGASRKSLIGSLTNSPIHDRELETAVLHSIGIFQGVDGARVHHIASQQKACTVASALLDARRKCDHTA